MPKGAAVQEIVEGSPAEAAGIQAGDVITKADEADITCGNDIVDFVGQASIGDEIILSVYRQGENMEISVVIEEQVKSALENEEEQENSSNESTQPQMFSWGNGNFKGHR